MPLLVGLLTLCAYLATAGPTFYWLDSGELAAAAWGLGVAHPPGHPLASLLGRLCCLLPFGTLSFRVSLACALQAAGASALVVLLGRRLLERLELCTPGWREGCSALAGLAAGLSYALWFQAVRAEVYALNVLLLVAVAHELVAWEQGSDRRRLLSAALLFGLALCNHHLLALLALPVLLLFVLLRRPGPRAARLLLAVLAAGLLGLTPLAYLPLRANRLPEVDWGAPRTASRFAWTVSARVFQQSLDRAARQSLSERAGGAAFALLGGLGPAAAVLALAGLYLLARRRETRRAALLLGGVTATNLVSPLLVGFDPQNPDAHGYLAVGVVFLAPGLAVLVGVLAHQALTRWRRRGWLAAAALLALALLLPLRQGLASWRACDLRGHWAAEETGRAQLSGPPGALLLTSFFQTIFNAWALRVTADLRPDLQIVHRHFLDQPGYREDLQRTAPELARATETWLAGEPSLLDLEALAETRLVLVELDLDLPQKLERRLGPAGLLPGFVSPRDALTVRRHLELVEAWRAAVGPVEEPETRRALLWTHYLLARHGCRERLPALARPHLRWARELGPADRLLGELAAGCAASLPR